MNVKLPRDVNERAHAIMGHGYGLASQASA